MITQFLELRVNKAYSRQIVCYLAAVLSINLCPAIAQETISTSADSGTYGASGKRIESDTEGVFYGNQNRYTIRGQGGVHVQVKNTTQSKWSPSSFDICIDGEALKDDTERAKKFIVSHIVSAGRDTDFRAATHGAYFVDGAAICKLPVVDGSAGEEIVVCRRPANAEIVYVSSSGETVFYDRKATSGGTLSHKIDRFISDGKNWYLE